MVLSFFALVFYQALKYRLLLVGFGRGSPDLRYGKDLSLVSVFQLIFQTFGGEVVFF